MSKPKYNCVQRVGTLHRRFSVIKTYLRKTIKTGDFKVKIHIIKSIEENFLEKTLNKFTLGHLHF